VLKKSVEGTSRPLLPLVHSQPLIHFMFTFSSQGL